MAGIEHGLPCVTTTGSQSDAFLLEYSGKAFLTSADDNVIEFTSQVRRIFEDADLRRQLGVEAQQLYAEEFKWDMIADRAISEMGQVPAK